MDKTHYLQFFTKTGQIGGLETHYEDNQITAVNTIKFLGLIIDSDRLCGLVVRVSGYRYRGPGFDPRRYQIF